MKERLKQIVQVAKERSISAITAAIAAAKTPRGQKKIFAALACILLIGAGFAWHSASQKRNAKYVVETLNVALKQNDLRGLLKYFDMPNIMADFVQQLVPLQAYFVYDTRGHKAVEEAVFTEQSNALLVQVALAAVKSGKAPPSEDSKKEPPKKEAPKKPAIANRLIEPYKLFKMPQLFPVEIIELLAKNSFTLHALDEDIAIVQIEFTHPTLNIQIPLKFLMQRGLTSWSITRLSNANLVLKQVAAAVRDQKNAAIAAFQAANRRVEEIFELHFKTLSCMAVVSQTPQPRDVTIIVNAEVTNKGQIAVNAASLNLALFTKDGHYLGNMPVDFAKRIPAQGTEKQSWRREVKSARKTIPLLFDAKDIRCAIKPSRILFEDGQSITFLPEKLLDGL